MTYQAQLIPRNRTKSIQFRMYRAVPMCAIPLVRRLVNEDGHDAIAHAHHTVIANQDRVKPVTASCWQSATWYFARLEDLSFDVSHSDLL